MPGSTHPGRVVRRSWQDGKSGPGRRQISQKPGSYPIKTASGKYKCGHANRSHILTKKATKRKRNLRQTNHVRAEDAGRLDRMLPYL
jgi:large subunit ribosomal protein L35